MSKRREVIAQNGERALVLAVVLIVVTAGAAYLGATRRGLLRTAQSMTTDTPTAGIPTPIYAIEINDNSISYDQLDLEIENLLDESPSKTRNVACNEAVDYFIEEFLTREDRATFIPTTNQATVTAIISSSIAMRTSNPDYATVVAMIGTPDIEFESLIRGTAIAQMEYEDHVGSSYPTPSIEEISQAMGDEPYGIINISVVPFSSREEGDVLMGQLSDEWGVGAEAEEFANNFLDRSASANGLSDPEESMEFYAIKNDMSEYPDYVRDAVSRGHRTGGLARFDRQDDTGVVYFINDFSIDANDAIRESVSRRLNESGEIRARATYIANLREESEIEINVDCDTY